MPDKRYQHPVAGLDADRLAAALQKSIEQVQKNFPPKTGVCVFVFDYGGGGMGYIANAEREGMTEALQEWINRQGRVS